ncbi:Zinc finger SWIM domain-containing protein 3 [Frankliniella fusca]|uniref:Zinc finger SWIM domain-containing protein 3 n=1 Tax=Frankliniella fusca TaxID=407009 RepID=A0AAE1LKE4_9NEOP|nr:Zinc finger SWIM domain-containing protein 3 [Frankliniella fusca]
MKQTVVEADLVAYKTDSSSCNCPHWHSYHLPCRHIILHRRLHGEPVYKPGEVDKRWHKSYQLSDMPQQSELKALKVVCSVVPSKMIPYKWNDKYNHCKAQCEVLCGIMAECCQDLYMERYNQLVELGEMWSAGKQVVQAEVSNISKISGFHFTSATNMVIKAESSSSETPECDLNVVIKAESSPTKTPDSDPGFENDKKCPQ